MPNIFSDENMILYRRLATGGLTAIERKTIIDMLARKNERRGQETSTACCRSLPQGA